MTTRWVGAVVVVFLAACTERSGSGPDGCGGQTCTERQRCDALTLRCVTNERPKVTLVGPTTVISGPTFEISGTVVDDTDDATLEWRDGVGEWHELQMKSDGSFIFTVPARDLDAEPMLITVRAADGTVEVERSTLVIVDRVAPKLELKAPQGVVGGGEVTVTVVARDGSEGLQDLSIGGQPIASPRTGTELSAHISIPLMDRSALAVAVTAKDLNGNRITQTFMLQVDGAGPALRFISPTAQTPVVSSASFRVEVEAADLSGVQQVRIAMDDGGFVDALPQDAGVWSAEFPLPLAELQVSFSAVAVDAVGNLSVQARVPLRVDRVAPTVEVAGPDPDSVPRSLFWVAARAGADAVSVNATFAGTTIPLTLENDGFWEGQMPVTVRHDYAEEFVVAVARDAAGNQRTSAPWRLYVDTVAPTLTFTTPTANAKLNRANFVGTDDVVVAWRIQDGDPQARTASVDGVPSTANDVRITTSASDDGRVITTSVVATDRGRNVTTASLTFSVDRVAPTIVSWLPAANARNVEPRSTAVTFSERVTGPTTATDALTISPGTAQPGTWNAAHSSWTSAVLAPYAVFTATLGGLADDSGNPLDVSSRKFHTAALTPASGTIVATNVTAFRVTSDSDGVVTIATTSPSGYRVFGLSPSTGVVQAPSVVDPNGGTFSLNASLTVDPVTLIATHRVGSARRGGFGTGPFTPLGLARHVITNGLAGPVGSTADAFGAVVSQPAFPGEVDATPYALVDGTTYLRGVASRTLSTSPQLVVAQSSATWAGFSTSPTSVMWSRFLCIAGPFGSSCASFSFSVATANPTELEAAISPGCLVATWVSGGQRAALFQPLSACDELRAPGTPAHPSCQNGAGPTPELTKLRVASFSGNGESTLLGAWDDGAVHLGKLTNPTACANAFTPVGNSLPEPATAFEPVQWGNKPALLYTDANRNLKLYVQ